MNLDTREYSLNSSEKEPKSGEITDALTFQGIEKLLHQFLDEKRYEAYQGNLEELYDQPGFKQEIDMVIRILIYCIEKHTSLFVPLYRELLNLLFHYIQIERSLAVHQVKMITAGISAWFYHSSKQSSIH